MGNLFRFILLAVATLHQFEVASQDFITTALPEKRLQVLWTYCLEHSVSDQDSAITARFFSVVAHTADSLGDKQLKAYLTYFRKCYRILFSGGYERHFAPGDHQTAINILNDAETWALQEGFEDIAGSCEHFMGAVYFRAARYGLAFEHLLKADRMFTEIGYEKVPAASIYLYTLGLDYYQFEEYDKSLQCLHAATRYPFFTSRIELNTLNSIGMIYGRFKAWDNAASFYRKTIAKAAAYADNTWLGIASGNLGNVFLLTGKNDSALFYHRINYYVNTTEEAGEDGAKSALSIASIFIKQQQPDSALFYIRSGQALANTYIYDSTESMKYRKRLLVVMIDYYKIKGDYKNALLLSDTVSAITSNLQQKLDTKIVSRAVEKVEIEGYTTKLALSESRKSLYQLRFYLITATLLLIILSVIFIFSRYRQLKNHQMQAAENEKQLMALEKMRTEEDLKNAEKRLTEYLLTLKEKTILIENLNTELHQLRETTTTSDLSTIAANIEKLVSSTILTDEDWRHFRTLFEQVYPGFLAQLNEQFTDLSPGETRLLILTKLDISTREMANMLGISIDAIRKARYRLRKRLNLDKDCDFETVVGRGIPVFNDTKFTDYEE